MLLLINERNNNYVQDNPGKYYIYLNDLQRSKIVLSNNYKINIQFQFRSPKNIIPVDKKQIYITDLSEKKIEIETSNFYGDYMNNTALAQQFLELLNNTCTNATLDENKLIYSNVLYITLPSGYSFVCEDEQTATVLGIETNKKYYEIIEGYRMINMNLCKSLKIYSSLATQTEYIESTERSLLLRSPILWENGSITTITSGELNIQGNQLCEKITFEFLTDENLFYPLPESFEMIMELQTIEKPVYQQSEESQLLNVLVQTMNEHNNGMGEIFKMLINTNQKQAKELKNIKNEINKLNEISSLNLSQFLEAPLEAPLGKVHENVEEEDEQALLEAPLEALLEAPLEKVHKIKVHEKGSLEKTDPETEKKNRFIDRMQQQTRRNAEKLEKIVLRQGIRTKNQEILLSGIEDLKNSFTKKLRSYLNENENENLTAIENYPKSFLEGFKELINNSTRLSRTEIEKEIEALRIFGKKKPPLTLSDLMPSVDNTLENINENEPKN